MTEERKKELLEKLDRWIKTLEEMEACEDDEIDHKGLQFNQLWRLKHSRETIASGEWDED
jgi:hypothetical protein